MAQKKFLRKAATKTKGSAIPDWTLNQWLGLVTSVKNSKELAKGAASDSSNWLTGKEKDHIELRRGYQLLGQTRQGAGRISGLGIGYDVNQKQFPFWTYGTTLAYFPGANGDSVIINANQFPAAAAADDFSIQAYDNLAGYWVYISSPHSSAYKIPVANPTSVIDMQQTAFRGNFQIKQNRTFLWNKFSSVGGWDKTSKYLSYIDKTAVASYAQLNETFGTGDGVTKTFSYSLPISGVLTAFSLYASAPVGTGVAITGITADANCVVTAPNHGLTQGENIIIEGVTGMTQINGVLAIVETVQDANNVLISIDSSTFSAYISGGDIYQAEIFIDDQDGNMTSTLGGTGTINYATGALVVNFNIPVATSQTVAISFYEEASTSAGIWDFSYSSPTRVAGQGIVFAQGDGGGPAMGSGSLNGSEYDLHQYKTWAVTLSNDDTTATNLIYRDKVGVPYFRAFDETGDGIPYLNFNDRANPYVEQLEVELVGSGASSIVPKTLSEALDLSNNGFDYPVVKEWSDYLALECQSLTSNGVNQGFNDTMYFMNRLSAQWDKLNLFATVLEEYQGALLAGDSLTNNIYQLFTGFTDDGSLINNYWVSGETNLEVAGRKKFYRLVVDGLISAEQAIQFWISYDGAPFVLIYTILGTGPYVDFNNPVTIGSTMIGSKPIGDGSPSGGAVNAYHYRKEIDYSDTSALASPTFEWARIKVVATNAGWAQVNEITCKDIRYKGRRVAQKYMTIEE